MKTTFTFQIRDLMQDFSFEAPACLNASGFAGPTSFGSANVQCPAHPDNQQNNPNYTLAFSIAKRDSSETVRP
jgi:hypothetical protein